MKTMYATGKRPARGGITVTREGNTQVYYVSWWVWQRLPVTVRTYPKKPNGAA